MKIAITGATGHIGINMVFTLISKGYDLRIIFRNPKKIKILDGLTFEKRQGDILDTSFLNAALEGIDVAIHLAGVISINGDPNGLVMRTNVEGTRSVVSACLKNNIKKLIHFSSVHAFKYNQKTPIVNENTPYANHRSFIYDQSKALGELEIIKSIEQGLNAYILNPTAVIGPHDYFNARSGELFIKLFTGKMPALIKGGFNWVDVRDIINATLYILENDAPSRRYLLTGHFAEFREIAATCEEVSGVKAPQFILPISFALLGLPFIRLVSIFSEKEPLYTNESLAIIKNANRNYSSALAKKELNYTVRSLKESIQDIYDWWKDK